MKLTPIEDGIERTDDVYSNDTVNLIEYGLRNGGIQSEYDLANRLQEMREVAIELIREIYAAGGGVNDQQLKTVDVLVERMVERRITL